MNFFDTRTMGQNERFRRVAIIIIPIAIVIGLFFQAVTDWIHVEYSVLYILVGALIGYLVLKIGRGAQPRFRYLAVGATIVAILSADVLYPVLFYNIGIFTSLRIGLLNLLEGPSGLISILFRVLSMIAAYHSSV